MMLAILTYILALALAAGATYAGDIGDSTRRLAVNATGQTVEVIDPNPSRLPLLPWGVSFVHPGMASKMFFAVKPSSTSLWPRFDAALLLSHENPSILPKDLNILPSAQGRLDNNNTDFLSFGPGLSPVQAFMMRVPASITEADGYRLRLANVSDWSRTYYYSEPFPIVKLGPSTPSTSGTQSHDDYWMPFLFMTVLCAILLAAPLGHMFCSRWRKGELQVPRFMSKWGSPKL